MKKYLFLFIICVLIFSLTNWSNFISPDDQITQYIAIDEGVNLKPVAKVVYRVFINRQEIVYWIEFPVQEHSGPYKLKKCIIFDRKNWEGEIDFPGWQLPRRVKFDDGKFQDANSVSWWAWHYETKPEPDSFAKTFRHLFIWGLFIAFCAFIGFIYKIIPGKKKFARNEKDIDKAIREFTKTQGGKFKNLKRY